MLASLIYFIAQKKPPLGQLVFHQSTSIQPEPSSFGCSLFFDSVAFLFLLVYGLAFFAFLAPACQRVQPFFPVPRPIPLFALSFLGMLSLPYCCPVIAR